MVYRYRKPSSRVDRFSKDIAIKIMSSKLSMSNRKIILAVISISIYYELIIITPQMYI